MRNFYLLIFIAGLFIISGGLQAQTVTSPAKDKTSGDDKKELGIYPNPSKDFIYVSGTSKVDHYEIFDILGSKVLRGTLNDDKQINIQNLINGVYFIRFNNGVIRKIIKK